MRLGRTGAARRRTLALTPLIDVIFLLLIFFVLSSTFVKYSSLEVSHSRPPSSASAADAMVPSGQRLLPDVIIRLKANGRIDINGIPVQRGSLAAVLDKHHENGARTAAMTPSSSATVQDLVSALEQARLSAFQTIEIVK